MAGSSAASPIGGLFVYPDRLSLAIMQLTWRLLTDLTAIASPVSAGSPCPMLAPRAAPANLEPASVSSPGVVTHKEWVVPPRPKPGRKPATDTPPTKRKAQNRAAQRAFRERRAARVNELEEKLKEVQGETAAREQEFKDQISKLNRDNFELTKENEQYKLKLESTQRELDLTLERLKTDQPSSSDFLTQVASPAPSAGNDIPCGQNCNCSDAVDKALCERSSAPSVPLRRSNRNRKNDIPTPEPLGCGSCTKDGECACYNEATAVAASFSSGVPKRPTSPYESVTKRTRMDFVETELETDFTATYMSRHPSSASSIAHVPDPCGFCSDGTPCICAEAATAMDMASSDVEVDPQEDVKLAPILGTPRSSSPSSHFFPNEPVVKAEKPMPLHPPSTIKAAVSLPRSGCRPGGCDQCRNDPMATLFCQSVSSRLRSKAGGCCGNGDCCQDIEGGSKKDSTKKGSKNAAEKTYIPCSAVYQTLSRHRAFRTTTDLGSLVRPLVVKGKEGTCPEVEISSVRDALKQLDRRFGSDAA